MFMCRFIVISTAILIASCSSGGTTPQSEPSAAAQAEADLLAANEEEERYNAFILENNYVGGFWDFSYKFPDGRYKEAYANIPHTGSKVTIYTYEGDSFGSGADCYNKFQMPMTTATGQPVRLGSPSTTEYLINGIRYTLVRTGPNSMDAVSVDTADLDQDGDVLEFITEVYIEVDNKGGVFSTELDAKLCP